MPGLVWNDDIDVPDYGTVYDPGTPEAAASTEAQKSWWDKLIDGAEAKVDELASKVEKATVNNPLVKLFTGFGRFQV